MMNKNILVCPHPLKGSKEVKLEKPLQGSGAQVSDTTGDATEYQSWYHKNKLVLYKVVLNNFL